MLLNSSLECWNVCHACQRAACLHQYGWTAPAVYVRFANTGCELGNQRLTVRRFANTGCEWETNG